MRKSYGSQRLLMHQVQLTQWANEKVNQRFTSTPLKDVPINFGCLQQGEPLGVLLGPPKRAAHNAEVREDLKTLTLTPKPNLFVT